MPVLRSCLLELSSIIRLAALACAVSLVGCLSMAAAHEGHDHDDAAGAALKSSTYPRVSAQSELYEITGILRRDRLSIYLDHFLTNEPVNDAKLKITIGQTEPIDAAPAENGV